MRVEKVRRQKDAQGAMCEDCPAVFNISTSPYWHWSKSLHMHRQGSGHSLVLYRMIGA